MFEARPPAKVNLTLEIVGRRPDGFHELRSLFLRIGLTDRLRMRTAHAGTDTLAVSGLAGAPSRGNLVLRAVEALRQRAGAALPALDIELEKSIPIGGGLAGGSSDAAAALGLAQACWGVRMSAELELEAAEELGSDVPFFVADAPAALVEGRGESVGPLPAITGDPGILLATPADGISTARAFSRYDDLGQRAGGHLGNELADAMSAGLDATGLAAWAERLRDANDLWPAAAAEMPALAGWRVALESVTRRSWLMSGSGPTLFAIYPSVEEARAAGIDLVSAERHELAGLRINAVDLTGPDPAWRYP